MIKKARLVGMALTPLLAGTPAAADSMRCGQSLVQPGDRITEVIEDCGEPDRSTSIVNNGCDHVARIEVIR